MDKPCSVGGCFAGPDAKETIMKRKTPLGIQRNSPAFTMIEILIVVAVIGILASVGTVAFVNQIQSTRVGSATSIINASLLQARQMAIAMRQSRRVAIDIGTLTGFGDGEISGQRTQRGRVWIEGKRCERFDFSEPAYCQEQDGSVENAYTLNEEQALPEGVAVASLGDLVLGPNTPQILYIEYNARGQATKIYFDGQENGTNLANTEESVLHLTQDNVTFDFGQGTIGYSEALEQATIANSNFENGEYAKERFKVDTIEIITLTGKTRVYDHASFGAWPSDEAIEQP